MSRPDGDGANVITCTHDGLAEHLWDPPRCPVAIPAGTWAVRPAAAAEADLRTEIGKWLVKNLFWGIDHQRGPEAAERLLAEVPALQRLVEQAAEAAQLRAWVEKAQDIELTTVTVESVRRALDGTDG